jgi:uncharacterized protein (DUF1330 family)
MSAYFIVHRREITDSNKLKSYRDGVGKTIERYGGKVVVRADGFEVLEGRWEPGRNRDDSHPERLTVIEFPSMAALKDWYESPDYSALKAIRQSSSVSDVAAVEGTPG